jgi:hypothetical protein
MRETRIETRIKTRIETRIEARIEARCRMIIGCQSGLAPPAARKRVRTRLGQAQEKESAPRARAFQGVLSPPNSGLHPSLPESGESVFREPRRPLPNVPPPPLYRPGNRPATDRPHCTSESFKPPPRGPDDRAGVPAGPRTTFFKWPGPASESFARRLGLGTGARSRRRRRR